MWGGQNRERKQTVYGKFHAPDNKMVIKAHPAPEAPQRGGLRWRGFPPYRCSCFPSCEVSCPAGQLGLPTLWPPAWAVTTPPGFGRISWLYRPDPWPPHSRRQNEPTQWDSPSAPGQFSPGKGNSGEGLCGGWQSPPKSQRRLRMDSGVSLSQRRASQQEVWVGRSSSGMETKLL